MRNPFRALSEQFLRISPFTVLFFSVAVALLDGAALFAASEHDGVLTIKGGVGLLQNFGLFSTVMGDAILLFLARQYYDVICSARSSKAVVDASVVDEPLSEFDLMIRLGCNKCSMVVRQMLYYLIIAGGILWCSNVGFHVLDDPVRHWGHAVFDSIDHPYAFVASRVHNLYTWLGVMPFTLYVVICGSIQLRKLFRNAVRRRAFRYDLLNPDRRGGFSFIEKSHLVFNVLVAVFYVQIMMHIETFERANVEHYIGIGFATLLLIFGNRIFLGDVHARIEALRFEALNATKENVYKNDALSFEILKYCYEHKVDRYSFLNILTKSAAVVFSAVVKLYPIWSKVLTRA